MQAEEAQRYSRTAPEPVTVQVTDLQQQSGVSIVRLDVPLDDRYRATDYSLLSAAYISRELK